MRSISSLDTPVKHDASTVYIILCIVNREAEASLQSVWQPGMRSISSLDTPAAHSRLAVTVTAKEVASALVLLLLAAALALLLPYTHARLPVMYYSCIGSVEDQLTVVPQQAPAAPGAHTATLRWRC
jgi:hypothetical protein